MKLNDQLDIAIQLSCEEEGVSRKAFLSKSRDARLVNARRLYFYLAVRVIKASHAAATLHANRSNHSTSVHYCKTAEDYSSISKHYKEKIDDLTFKFWSVIKHNRPKFRDDREEVARKLKVYVDAQQQVYRITNFELFSFLAKSVMALDDESIAAMYGTTTEESNEALAKVLHLLFDDSKTSPYLAHHTKQAQNYLL